MKPYQIAMGVALLGAGGLVLFGDRTPASDVAEAVVRSGPAARAPHSSAKESAAAKPETMIFRLQPRELLIGDAGDAAFASNEGVFLSQNWNPPPPKMSAAAAAAAAAPPPPPMAPPLPFTYVGKAAADGAWEVYLARADKTYVVRVKTVIDGVYRVEAIAPPVMSVTYLPLNQVQQLNIGVLD